jgi:glycine/D-amino acid oxidase-like deaminating enzyme
MTDVVVVGAGVVGCACALFLAERGARVVVFDGTDIASGASGRNSGLVEHPFDEAQHDLHQDTLALLEDVLDDRMPGEPAGVLILVDTKGQAEEVARRHAGFSGLNPLVLSPDDLKEEEPLLAPGLWACHITTGYPVEPALAAMRLAERARRLGVEFYVGQPARLLRDETGVHGVETTERVCQSDAVVVAAGASSSAVIDPSGTWRPVSALWGVSMQVHLAKPPRHALITGRVAEIQAGAAGGDAVAFSLIGTPSAVGLGSTFLADRPDPQEWAPRLLEEGKRYWRGLSDAAIGSALACPRPRAFDGRPLLGPVKDVPGLWLASGHGGRGISTGAASAQLVAEAVVSRSQAVIPEALRAERAGAPPLIASE